MAKEYKIAIVGNRDAIMPFKMIGIETFPVVTKEEAQETLDRLAQDDYGIIYLTEDFAQEIPETIKHYDSLVTPAVILLPTHKGSLGLGMKRIQENVRKAVGADILQ